MLVMRINKVFRKKMLEEQGKKDSAEIRRYEKLLKLNRRKKKDKPSKAFCDMGLDYILEVIEGGNKESEIVKECPESRNFFKKHSSSLSSQGSVVNSNSLSISEENNQLSHSSDSESEDSFNEESSGGEEESVDGNVEVESIPDDEAKGDALHEDIYGRLRDKHGNVIASQSSTSSYLTSKSAEVNKESDDYASLKKSLRRLINCLSEKTMAKVSSDVESLFRKYPRAVLNAALSECIILLIKNQGVSIIERILLDCALLVGILHRNVGAEVSTSLIEQIYIELHLSDQKLFSSASSEAGFAFHNLILFIMHLTSFNVISCKLPFDILHCLLTSFSSTSLEMMIICLKGVGLYLRRSDPVRMKSLIDEIQDKARATEAASFADPSRIQFMLDILLAIKNNNYRKIPGYDTSYCEHLKKIMKQFVKKDIAEKELNLSLDDLRSIQSKGRWWVVGSSFIIPDRASNEKMSSSQQETDKSSTSLKSDDKIIGLALKLGFKSDLRQKLFAALVTASDVDDALVKLHSVGLNKSSEKDLVSITMKCLLAEKTYNNFYTNIFSRLCSRHRRLVLMIKCSFWDQFTSIPNLKLNKLRNLSQSLAQLVLSKSLPLKVLKKCPFEGVATCENVAKFIALFVDALLANSMTEEFSHFLTQLVEFRSLFSAFETSLVFTREKQKNCDKMLTLMRRYKN